MSFFAELKRRNVIRVGIAYSLIAWVTLQAAEFGLELVGAPMWVIRSLSVLALIGLPLALLFSWVYEMTPEGLKLERDIQRDESITPRTGRRLDRIIIAFLAITVVFLVASQQDGWDFGDGTDDSAATPAQSDLVRDRDPDIKSGSSSTSIAVLPFVNMSADADNEYFSDGISEELLNVLVRVSALEVASRTSSFAYKGKDTPISQIAEELGVDHVLEGSVRKAGNRVRITAQLIDTETDRHLWSDTYDRELDDIFGIQDEISKKIVEALKLALDVGEAEAIERLNRPTDNPEAYEHYLQGRYQWRLRLEENIRNSIESFEAAIALDPEFAKAHEALASAWTVLPAWAPVAMAEVKAPALSAANRALELDPTLAEALSIKAHFSQISGDWVAAFRQFGQARELEPRNASVAQWFAEFLGDAGYLRQSMEMAQAAYTLDPASRVINMVMTGRAAYLGDDELAIRHAKKAIELGMEPRRGTFSAFDAYWRTGRTDDIRRYLVDSPKVSPFVSKCTRAMLEPGNAQTLSGLLASDTSASIVPRIWCTTRLEGDVDEAMEPLERLLTMDNSRLRHVWNGLPMGQRIRASERFKQMLRDLRVIEQYEAHGWPDLCRPLDGGDFKCE